MTNSKVHHYIPQFHSRGFCNNQNMFFIYDKEKDIVDKKQKSPKSYFFEWNRNSINIDNQNTVVIEDLFSWLDDLFSKENRLQKIDSKNLEMIEVCKIVLFVTSLYCRVKPNDSLTLKLIDQYHKEVLKRIPQIDLLNRKSNISNDDLNKVLSVFLPMVISKSTTTSSFDNTSKFYFEIVNFEKDTFILSDIPFIYKNQPKSKDEFNSDLIFPISSKSIFLILNSSKYTITQEDIMTINYILIDQAQSYVAFPDYEVLKSFANGYKY